MDTQTEFARNYSEENLDQYFTYHPPTEVTAPLHDKVNEAYRDAGAIIKEVYHNETDKVVAAGDINRALLGFAQCLLNEMPYHQDLQQAITELRLARNALNEGLHVANLPGRGGGRSSVFLDKAKGSLLRSKWLANGAIAVWGAK